MHLHRCSRPIMFKCQEKNLVHQERLAEALVFNPNYLRCGEQRQQRRRKSVGVEKLPENIVIAKQRLEGRAKLLPSSQWGWQKCLDLRLVQIPILLAQDHCICTWLPRARAIRQNDDSFAESSDRRLSLGDPHKSELYIVETSLPKHDWVGVQILNPASELKTTPRKAFSNKLGNKVKSESVR